MDFHAARWADGIAVMREVGHIKTKADGEALARSLGDANALLLRAHGLVLTSESAPAILADTTHFQDNLKAMKEALSFGRELEPLTAQDLARVQEYMERDHHIAKMWNYYVAEGRKSGAIPDDWEVAL